MSKFQIVKLLAQAKEFTLDLAQIKRYYQFCSQA